MYQDHALAGEYRVHTPTIVGFSSWMIKDLYSDQRLVLLLVSVAFFFPAVTSLTIHLFKEPSSSGRHWYDDWRGGADDHQALRDCRFGKSSDNLIIRAHLRKSFHIGCLKPSDDPKTQQGRKTVQFESVILLLCANLLLIQTTGSVASHCTSKVWKCH